MISECIILHQNTCLRNTQFANIDICLRGRLSLHAILTTWVWDFNQLQNSSNDCRLESTLTSKVGISFSVVLVEGPSGDAADGSDDGEGEKG